MYVVPIGPIVPIGRLHNNFKKRQIYRYIKYTLNIKIVKKQAVDFGDMTISQRATNVTLKAKKYNGIIWHQHSGNCAVHANIKGATEDARKDNARPGSRGGQRKNIQD